MAFSRNQQAVAELYIAALGRSPEMGGLDYWVSQLESGKKSLMEIQSSFFDINLPEVAARFPIGTTSREYVESIYLNVFERASDEGGLAYWANRLDLPQTDANHLSTATLMSTMLDIAKDPANFIDGAVLSANLATAESIYQNEFNSSNNTINPPVIDGNYEIQNLGLGFTLFVEKNINTTFFSYSYDPTTKTLIQTDSYGNIEHQIFNNMGEEIRNIDFDENGKVETIYDYIYNSQSQLIKANIQFYEDGIKVGEGITTNIWSHNQVLSTFNVNYSEDDNYSFNAIGLNFNKNNDAPLIWKIDEDNDGVYDSIDYYTYDAYGNEIKDEEDSNADGIIDYVYNTNWMILV